MIEVYSESMQLYMAIVRDEIARFLEVYGTKTGRDLYIPHKVIIFPQETNSRLGFCRKESLSRYVIGISDYLFTSSIPHEYLQQVVGHEVAHLIDLWYNFSSAHDKYFKDLCELLGITNDQAYFKKDCKVNPSNIMNKIKKLLALSESSNINESQSALMKARKLMTEYHINIDTDDTQIYRVALVHYTRFTAEYQVLSRIVSWITGVWNLRYTYSSKDRVLYAHGSKTEIEIAEYLFDYLQRELEHHYTVFKKNHTGNLSSAKSSFYYGIQNQMKKRFVSHEVTSNTKWDLVKVEGDNERLAQQFIYTTDRIVSSKSIRRRVNRDADMAGKRVGKTLKIHNGVTAGKNTGKLLGLV